jgi:hypothetical protein
LADSSQLRRPSVVDKILQHPAPRYEPEVEEAQQSLKETRLAVATPMLDIILRSGHIRSFSYAYLSEVEFEPGDTLTLKFTTGAAIIAEGRGLARHRQLVRLHRADEIRECAESELTLLADEGSVVERITITEGEKP